MVGKHGPSSSQCIYNGSVSELAVSKLIKSLSPVKSVHVISPDSFELPLLSQSTTVSGTLRQILDQNPVTAICIPNNDTSDAILVRENKLWLHLSPESFASFGLDAKKFGTRYLAVYDLKTPGKRLDRLNWALEHTITATYDFLVLHAQQKNKSTAKSTVLDILVPQLSLGEDEDDEGFQDWSNNLVEWVGFVFLRPQLLARDNGGVDPAICDYRQYPESERATVCASHISQAVSYSDIENVWHALKISQTWFVMHVGGFELAPVSWNPDRPHEAGKEVGYTLVKNGDTVNLFKYLA